jgi:Cu(I)/Ag(I) efflux system membrane fusion protein
VSEHTHLTGIHPTLRWLARSAGAVAVVVVILLALIAGVWLGRTSVTPAAAPTSDDAHADAGELAAPSMYTCSMHPQIRLPDADAKCPICFMALIPVDAGDGDEGERALVMTPAAVALASIRTEPVTRMFPMARVRMVGKIDFDETRLAAIAAYFPGRLERLYVDYTGVTVRRGDHMAEVYSPELLAAQEELRQARAAVASMQDSSETVRTITDATLQAARGKLRLWGLTDEQISAIETSETPLPTVTLYAPISGVVIDKQAVEGRYVQTGEEIYRLADLDRLWMRLEAYESDLPLLRYGQEVTFTTDALPGETFDGVVAFISPVVDPMRRTVAVRVNVDNTQRLLKPGMFVRATVDAEVGERGVVVDESLAGLWMCPMHPEETGDGPGACAVCGMDLVPAEELGYVVDPGAIGAPLTIPATAPLITGRRAVVYVRDPDAERPTFLGREVTLGPRAGDRYIVRGGLAEGEQVVVEGAFRIDSAMQIRAQPSMMSPPAPADPEPEAAPAPAREAASPAFLAAIAPVYEAYFAVQEALADDDLEAFRTAATSLHDAVRIVDGDAPASWAAVRDGFLTSAEHVGHFASLDEARVPFEAWSTAALDLEARFGHAGEATHYEAYCPMAFDFEGASWLQRAEEIDNPYFGDLMLRCGEIRRTFEPVGGDR